jgi:hypothetical protein
MRALIWSQAGITWYHIRTSSQIFALGLVVLSKKEESVSSEFLFPIFKYFSSVLPLPSSIIVYLNLMLFLSLNSASALFYLFCIENIFVSRFIHYKLLKSSSSNNIIIVNAIMRRKHHCTLTIPTLASSAPIP